MASSTNTDTLNDAIEVNTADIDVSIAKFQKRNRLVDRITAGAIIFARHENGELYTWMIQREDQDSSHGLSWEWMSGKPEKVDGTSTDTARRECEEEGKYRPSKFADRAVLCFFLHKDRRTDRVIMMASLTFIIVDDHQKLPTRVWSDTKKGPDGAPSLQISAEHINDCWMTETQIEEAAIHDQCSDPRNEFNMLQTKINVSKVGFKIFKDYQAQ
ncbi:hypothetical protein N7468_010359 [Penicillium chermesinum]|uniref:Nudix hydrolase domain-containing protein n=1 Tax=Penicillium chermesinum TaxID=63820 RepID=A0A9W9NCI7_9EURO|nr:uncharacterized protein N7468_010359 [Penicillium chermesinum]KAJ5217351.1 hypothetical protein N7468_010359 [Penicillium chermesinum]KAJ6171037.1 hypothetical protein N7470_000104 [Penicillium chermesinum]